MPKDKKTPEGQELKDAPQETDKVANPEEEEGEDLQREVEKIMQAVGATSEAEALVKLSKSQKEAHAKVTTVSQERAELERQLEELSLSKGAEGESEISKEEEESDFFDNPGEKVRKIIRAELHKERIISRLAALRQTNKEEFDELKPYMDSEYNANPRAADRAVSPVDYLYGKAKERRDRYIASLRKTIIGDVDVEAIKAKAKEEMLSEIKRNVAATLPGGTSASVPSSSAITSKIAMARDKGDVKGTLDAIFEREEERLKAA
ncbi:MAG: hypothetical protein DDT31_01213 [Syntrophomonadaceae bacterium]|nr:hypothetical protein [Bacillota bacterium]